MILIVSLKSIPVLFSTTLHATLSSVMHTKHSVQQTMHRCKIHFALSQSSLLNWSVYITKMPFLIFNALISSLPTGRNTVLGLVRVRPGQPRRGPHAWVQGRMGLSHLLPPATKQLLAGGRPSGRQRATSQSIKESSPAADSACQRNPRSRWPVGQRWERPRERSSLLFLFLTPSFFLHLVLNIRLH